MSSMVESLFQSIMVPQRTSWRYERGGRGEGEGRERGGREEGARRERGGSEEEARRERGGSEETCERGSEGVRGVRS